MLHILLLITTLVAVCGAPFPYETTHFRVGIEYDHSLPMNGGSDRYRHRNNYDPFFVTISATAKNGYVISYLDVSASVDVAGQVDFRLIRGATGSRTMTFQLVSNNSDFLSYTYLAYGIREDEYKKIANIISLPLGNNGSRLNFGITNITFIIVALFYSFVTFIF